VVPSRNFRIRHKGNKIFNVKTMRAKKNQSFRHLNVTLEMECALSKETLA